MVSLYYGLATQTGVPADEATVRSTATPVDINAPAAMQDDMPEMGEVETDPNPNLGLSSRQMASAWHQGVTGVTPLEMAKVSAGTDNNSIINSQVSSSGLAASQEAAGQSNPNLSYAVGIEPVGDLRDGGKMGNEYFVRNERDVQQGMGDFMTKPPGYDVSTRAIVDATGKERAAKASNPYSVWWGNYSG